MNNDTAVMLRVDKKTVEFLMKHIKEFHIRNDEDKELAEQLLEDIQFIAAHLDAQTIEGEN